MKNLLLTLSLAITLPGISQDHWVTLGNAIDYALQTEAAVSYNRGMSYVNQKNSTPVGANYLGFQVKLEYGLFRQFKLTSHFDMINFKPQNGLVGIKYELPFATYKVLKTGNSFAFVVVPQINFIFPMSKYDTESLEAIGNRNFGLGVGSTIWFPIYRINSDLKLYAGFNLFKNPVPKALQLRAKFGKLFGPVYIGLIGEFQKSFGSGNYFSGFSTFNGLPVSYSKLLLDAKYCPSYNWEIGLQPSWLFRGKNVRKSLGVELRFMYLFGGGEY